MIRVTFLGTAASRPTVGRNVSAVMIHRGGDSLLFDCGEGTQRQMMRYGSGFAVHDIFFTHMHADHFLGVIGLLRTMGLQSRIEPMRLWAPAGSTKILHDAVNLGVERLPFPVEIAELEPDQRVERSGYNILAYSSRHGPRSLGYALVESERLGRFDPERARALGVPEGPLFGRLHRGEAVEVNGRTVAPADLVGPTRPGRRVVYTGDTRPCRETIDIARAADLLIHDATFTHEEAVRARETNHSTAREAAELAKEAGVQQLALTHISARYADDVRPLEREARAVFPCTVVASDGLTIEVPFREMQTDTDMRVPGDKSITHRALILAGVATGRSRIRLPLIGADTQATAGALRALGVDISALTDEVTVTGVGLHGLRAAGDIIDCGNSGTTARLLMGVLAGCPFDTTLSGDASLRSRPMRRVTAPLALMGATFDEIEAPDRLPIRMRGGALRPLCYDSPHASAQVKSAILLAGLTGSADVTVSEPVLSRDHTERMLLRLGVALRRGQRADGRVDVTLSPAPHLNAFEIDVPGDFSSAAFLAGLALLAAPAPVTIRAVGLNPTRTGFLDVVRRMGGRVDIANVRESCGEPLGDIIVERSSLRATRITAAEMPSLVDEVPILAILAARAAGTTVIEGAAELRVKESDRIRALVTNLEAVGVVAVEHQEGLEVEGSDSTPRGHVRVHGDHRIAMAFGVLSAATGGAVHVDQPDTVAVSFPEFWEAIAAIGAQTLT